MIKRLWRVLLPGMMALALTGAIRPGTAAAVVVSVSPFDTTVSTGAGLTVAITTDAVADLKGFKLIYAYNPAVLRLTGIDPGEVLTGNGRAFFSKVVNEFDVPSDTAWFEAAMLDGSTSGPGVLAYLHFSALGVGSSSITCRTVTLRDSDNQLILSTCNSGAVHVTLAPAPGTVVVSPPDTAIILGQNVTIGIVTGAVPDLKGFKIIFGYDPGLLQLNGASPGEVLTLAPGGYSSFLVPDVAPHDSARYEAAILSGSVTGPGPLVYFHFTTLAYGTSPISCRLVDYRNSLNVSTSPICVPGQVRVVSAVGVGRGEAPGSYLRSARPNPSRGQTALEFALREAGNARLEILAVDGRKVRGLVDGYLSAGAHWANWNGRDAEGRDVPAGIYFARLTGPHGTWTTRLARLR